MPDLTDSSEEHATSTRTGRSESGPRRGWREQIEPGLYRAHRLGCRSTIDRRSRRRCACPYEIQYPGRIPGRTTSLIVHGGLDDARPERRRRQAAPRKTIPSSELADVVLDDFAAQYFRAKAPVLAGATIRTRDEDYRKRIAPALGALSLPEITRERVAIWLAELAGSAPSSRMTTQTVATLRVILAAAVEWGRIETNPAAGLKVPNTTIEERSAITRVLDRTQLETPIAAASALRSATILRTAGEAGLRKGEIIGMRWTDVVLDERRIEVKRAVWQEHPGQGQPAVRHEKPTKSGKARRVAISSKLADDLAAWYGESVETGGADPGGYVWPG